MNTPFNWEGILDDDEKILWQGQPFKTIHLHLKQPMAITYGVFHLGIALYLVNMLPLPRELFSGMWAFWAPAVLWTGALLLFLNGFFNVIGVHFWKSFLRRHTYYTLTNRRALIATQPFGKRMFRSYPITKTTLIEWKDADPATIIFANEIYGKHDSVHKVNIGFERILDDKKVYTLLRKIQMEAA